MKKMVVRPSKETERLHIIQQLNLLGIYETTAGNDLNKVGHHTLRSMLAIEKAVRS